MPDEFDTILRINADSVPGVSVLAPGELEQLFNVCARFRVAEFGGEVAGYLCALERTADYDGEEFQWFKANLPGNFLYIDQVAISPNRRRAGLGRVLYEDLGQYARRHDIASLACEVNHDPFNTESQDFHKRCGFGEVSRMATRGAVVSLLIK